MPKHISVLKRQRQNLKRRMINKKSRTRLRSQLKNLRTIIASGDEEKARQALTATISNIDKSVTKGVIHKNAAARLKSRLSRQVNALASKVPVSTDSS